MIYVRSLEKLDIQIVALYIYVYICLSQLSAVVVA